MNKIQSKKHKIRTYEVNKTSLSCLDYKRFVLDDGAYTLVYFHKDYKKQESFKRFWQIRISLYRW